LKGVLPLHDATECGVAASEGTDDLYRVRGKKWREEGKEGERRREGKREGVKGRSM
jgi:hypothetical protein